MVVILAGVAILAEVLVALACLYLVFYIIAGLFQLLNAIPGFRAIFGGVEDAITHAINAAIGAAVRTAQKVVGVSWHWAARYSERVWHSIETGQSFNASAAKVSAVQTAGINRLGTRQHSLARAAPTTAARVKTLEREYNGIEHQIRDLQREVGKGIGNDIRLHIKALEREAANIQTQINDVVVPHENTLTGEIGNILDWAGGKASLLGIGSFAFAIASALGLNSLGGFLCNEFRNILGRGCSNLWGGLESLLSLFIDVLVLTDLCKIIPEAVTFFGLIEGEITGLISQAAQSVCASFNPNWTTPDVAPGPTPPPQAFDQSTLAAGG